jgi:hypothetical protein
MRPLRPLLGVLARAPAGRGAVLGGLRALPWLATEDEARSALAGFADSTDFWRLLWWAIMADLPTGLKRVRCPVTLAQGTVDLLAGGQTPRYLLTVPGARFASLAGEGHSPMSDTPATVVELVTETVRRAGAAAPDRHQTDTTTSRALTSRALTSRALEVCGQPGERALDRRREMTANNVEFNAADENEDARGAEQTATAPRCPGCGPLHQEPAALGSPQRVARRWTLPATTSRRPVVPPNYGERPWRPPGVT